MVSEERHKEDLENGSGTGEAPGWMQNLGTGQVPGYPIDGGKFSYKKNSEIINRIFTETLTAQEKAVGTVNFNESSMTVALWYGNRVPDDSKLTQEFIDQFKQSLSNATGIPVVWISVDGKNWLQQKNMLFQLGKRLKSFSMTMVSLY